MRRCVIILALLWLPTVGLAMRTSDEGSGDASAQFTRASFAGLPALRSTLDETHELFRLAGQSPSLLGLAPHAQPASRDHKPTCRLARPIHVSLQSQRIRLQI